MGILARLDEGRTKRCRHHSDITPLLLHRVLVFEKLCHNTWVLLRTLHMSELSLTFIMGMAQGVCFTVLRKSKAGLGVDCVRGHGFCVARRPLKPVTPRKTFMHWASVDTFRPGLSVLDAGLPRKDSAEDKEERQEWTAPCYFDISIMGCGDSFGALHPLSWI